MIKTNKTTIDEIRLETQTGFDKNVEIRSFDLVSCE